MMEDNEEQIFERLRVGDLVLGQRTRKRGQISGGHKQMCSERIRGMEGGSG